MAAGSIFTGSASWNLEEATFPAVESATNSFWRLSRFSSDNARRHAPRAHTFSVRTRACRNWCGGTNSPSESERRSCALRPDCFWLDGSQFTRNAILQPPALDDPPLFPGCEHKGLESGARAAPSQLGLFENASGAAIAVSRFVRPRHAHCSFHIIQGRDRELIVPGRAKDHRFEWWHHPLRLYLISPRLRNSLQGTIQTSLEFRQNSPVPKICNGSRTRSLQCFSALFWPLG